MLQKTRIPTCLPPNETCHTAPQSHGSDAAYPLLRSSIQCIRGACSAIGRAARQQIPPIDLVYAEAGISHTVYLLFTIVSFASYICAIFFLSCKYKNIVCNPTKQKNNHHSEIPLWSCVVYDVHRYVYVEWEMRNFADHIRRCVHSSGHNLVSKRAPVGRVAVFWLSACVGKRRSQHQLQIYFFWSLCLQVSPSW